MRKTKAFVGLQLVRFGLFVMTNGEGDYNQKDAATVIKLWNLHGIFSKELAS